MQPLQETELHPAGTRDQIAELEADLRELKVEYMTLRVLLTEQAGVIANLEAKNAALASTPGDHALSPDDCWICGEGAGHVLAACPTDPETHPRP